MKRSDHWRFPVIAHPMGVLAFLRALTAFNPKSVNVDNEKEMYHVVLKTMGKFLVIATDIPQKHGVSFELRCQYESGHV
jgi:hypothetical protein